MRDAVALVPSRGSSLAHSSSFARAILRWSHCCKHAAASVRAVIVTTRVISCGIMPASERVKEERARAPTLGEEVIEQRDEALCLGFAHVADGLRSAWGLLTWPMDFPSLSVTSNAAFFVVVLNAMAVPSRRCATEALYPPCSRQKHCTRHVHCTGTGG